VRRVRRRRGGRALPGEIEGGSAKRVGRGVPFAGRPDTARRAGLRSICRKELAGGAADAAHPLPSMPEAGNPGGCLPGASGFMVDEGLAAPGAGPRIERSFFARVGKGGRPSYHVKGAGQGLRSKTTRLDLLEGARGGGWTRSPPPGKMSKVGGRQNENPARLCNL